MQRCERVAVVEGTNHACGWKAGCAVIPPLRPAPASGALVAALIALGFMQLASAPSITRSFAIAGVLWLTVLLGLAIMDPLTRASYGVVE